jgi:hypothetical protein
LKGCAIRGLLSLFALVAIVFAIGGGIVHWYGVRRVDVLGVSIFAGFFAFLALNLVWSAIDAWRKRAALRGGIAGTPPVDGKQTILVGYIAPSGGATLTAPLSGRPCVAYTFEIYEMRGSGRRSTKVVYCEGIALTPSSIVTNSGSYQLLAVPELDCEDSEFERKTALVRARELMRTLPFEPLVPFAKSKLAERWNDADGAYRRDINRVEGVDDRDPSAWRLTERTLESNARVCVFGQYSAAKRAIVANPNDWSKITRVMKGAPDSIVRQLGASIIRRMIGAVVCAAAATGLLAAFISSLP